MVRIVLNLELGDNKWLGLIEKATKNENHEIKVITQKENLDHWF